MIHIKICPVCKKQFKTEQNARKYCKNKCAYAALKKRKKKQMPVLCQWCGQIFKSDHKVKFCNTLCRGEYMKNLIIFKKKVTKVPVKVTIEDAVKGSREEGITYGRYVKLYRL